MRTVTGSVSPSAEVTAAGRLATIRLPSHEAKTVDPSVVIGRADSSPTCQT
jgi:hypothetical protein